MRRGASKTGQTRPPDLRYGRDPIVALCLVAVLITSIGFGVWAATAQLAQGVTASGTLIVQDRRRTVQHFEGGIIEDLFIQEGDRVRAGDVAMIISDASATARFSQTRVERLRLLAQLDRLSTQLARSQTLAFPSLDGVDAPQAMIDAVQAAERRVFLDQLAALEGERALIQARIDRLESEAAALDVRREGKRREIATLRDEQSVQTEALNERMGNISRVNELARLLVIAETELLNLDEEQRVIERAVQEAELELAQIDLRATASVAEDYANAAAQLAILTEELNALGDRMRRSEVIVPVDGVVIDLAYTSVAAIVGQGETIFQLVPSESSYEIEVRFAPQDRDDLTLGRDVNLRFGTLDPINPPQITGVLEQISADATYDEQSRSFYFRSRITIPPEQLAVLQGYTISPGIPVEVFFDKGAPRTPLSYFMEPVMEMIRLGMRS